MRSLRNPADAIEDVAWAGAGAVPAGCTGTALDTLKTTIENTLAQAKQNLEKDLDNILKALEQFLETFKTLVIDPGTFLNSAFSALTNLLVQVIDALLDEIGAVAQLAMSIVTGVVDGFIYLFSAEIHIPVISDLWQAISSDPLSIMDVAALILAIPATIIQKASSTSNARELGGSSTQELWWALSCITGGLVDGFADGNSELQPNNPLALLDDAFGALSFGLSYPSGDGLTWYENVFFALSGLPGVLNVVNAILAETESEAAESYNATMPWFLRVLGVLNIGSSVNLAFQKQNCLLGRRWREPDCQYSGQCASAV